MIVVFHLDALGNARHAQFDSTDLVRALEQTRVLRQNGASHVVISSEMDECVGKPGVDSVVDGKTPDGEDYDWSKAGRAGRARRGDENKPGLGTKNDN